MDKKNIRVIITDIESRKAFDLLNILKHLYGYTCVLTSTKKHRSLLTVIFGQKVHRLRTHANSVFKKDFEALLEEFKDKKLVYIPSGETATRRVLEFLESNDPEHLYTMLPTKEHFELCCDKGMFQKYCEQQGFPVPESFTFNKLKREGEKVLPVIVKPKSGEGSVGIKHVNNLNDIHQLDNLDFEKHIIQQKIKSNTKVNGAFYLCRDGVVISQYTHKRLRTFPENGGVTVCSRSGFNKEILHIGSKLLKQLNWNGVAMIEFLYDEDKERWFIIELNPRLWGSILLSAANKSKMLNHYVQICLGDEPENIPTPQEAYIRWMVPFEIINLFKRKISLRNLITSQHKNTGYVNISYAPVHRSFLYLIYFLFNPASFKRFLKKIF